MPNVYDKGDLVRCTATFTVKATGAAIDPATVTFKVEDPSGNETSYVYGTDPEVVKDDTGVYHIDVSPDEWVHWTIRCEATGTGQSGGERVFDVRPSAFS